MRSIPNKNRKRGRPPIFSSVEELQDKIDEYFASCWIQTSISTSNVAGAARSQPYTISGLALFLGVNRDTLLNYQAKDAFFGTIKRAKWKCEAYAEELLVYGNNPKGVIFSLKNNYGWRNILVRTGSGDLPRVVHPMK